jgi:hypothetical protein
MCCGFNTGQKSTVHACSATKALSIPRSECLQCQQNWLSCPIQAAIYIFAPRQHRVKRVFPLHIQQASLHCSLYTYTNCTQPVLRASIGPRPANIQQRSSTADKPHSHANMHCCWPKQHTLRTVLYCCWYIVPPRHILQSAAVVFLNHLAAAACTYTHALSAMWHWMLPSTLHTAPNNYHTSILCYKHPLYNTFTAYLVCVIINCSL